MPDFTAPVMNGLAARFKWSVTPSYADANHEPVIKGALAMSAKPGEKLKLKYTVTDPDKDAPLPLNGGNMCQPVHIGAK